MWSWSGYLIGYPAKLCTAGEQKPDQGELSWWQMPKIQSHGKTLLRALNMLAFDLRAQEGLCKILSVCSHLQLKSFGCPGSLHYTRFKYENFFGLMRPGNPSMVAVYLRLDFSLIPIVLDLKNKIVQSQNHRVCSAARFDFFTHVENRGHWYCGG